MRDRFVNFIANREARIIIGLSLLVLICVSLCSCHKQDIADPVKPEPYVQPCFNIGLAKDVIWKPIFSGYDYPGLKSNGDYYESGVLRATWSFNGCDQITVTSSTNAGYNFSFGISRLTADTLEVITARFGVTLFYK